MTSRFYTNDGGLALSAATFNALEADVDKGIAAFTSVGTVTLNAWQPGTVYVVNRFVLNPDGLAVKTLTAHTSGGTYDASKFSAPVSAPATPVPVPGAVLVSQFLAGAWEPAKAAANQTNMFLGNDGTTEPPGARNGDIWIREG
jgi:hypothetical protein